MKCFIGIDPGVSGGYAIAFDDLTSVHLHPWGDECEFVHHMRELSDNPDIESIESAVEKVPPFAGKLFLVHQVSSSGIIMVFWKGCLRPQIPLTLIKPQEWQKGLGGLQGLTSNKRKKALMNHADRFFPQVKGLTLKTADGLLILRHFLLNT